MFADATAEKYLDILSVESTPVSVDKLPGALGLEIIYCPLGSRFNGIYLTYREIPFITIEEQLKTAERRRAIAHECGHRALHHPARRLCLKNLSVDDVINPKEEYQAELFAAYFLIPRGTNFENCTKWELADRLQVPIDLLEFRIEHEKNQSLSYF